MFDRTTQRNMAYLCLSHVENHRRRRRRRKEIKLLWGWEMGLRREAMKIAKVLTLHEHWRGWCRQTASTMRHKWMTSHKSCVHGSCRKTNNQQNVDSHIIESNWHDLHIENLIVSYSYEIDDDITDSIWFHFITHVGINRRNIYIKNEGWWDNREYK